jgi:hypothetical protein
MKALGASLLAGSMLMVACYAPAPDPKKDDTQTFGEVLLMADEDFAHILRDPRDLRGAASARNCTSATCPSGFGLLAAALTVFLAGFLPGADQVTYFRSRGMAPHDEPSPPTASRCWCIPPMRWTASRSINCGSSWAARHGRACGAQGDLQRQRQRRRPYAGGFPFHGDAGLLKNASAVNSPEELLARVDGDPNAMGFSAMPSRATIRASRTAFRVKILPVARSGAAFPRRRAT